MTKYDVPSEMGPAVNGRRVSTRRHQVDEGECPYCDRERAAANTFHPSHDASDRCESGKRPHCTCDVCF